MKTILSILILCALGVSVAKAQSSLPVRLAALSQIESGDDDAAVGEKGEVSRYQILPRWWSAATNQFIFLNGASFSPENQWDAAVIARAIARERINRFIRSHHRPPTDFEFYKLWNPLCPSETAERFSNLCQWLATTGHREEQKVDAERLLKEVNARGLLSPKYVTVSYIKP